MNPEELDVAPGFEKHDLQGRVWRTATEAELREGLDQAFDYRGDVTITLDDGSEVRGYVFDRRPGRTLAESVARVYLEDRPEKVSVPYSRIAGIAFTGRDPAAGKSWAAWVKKYLEKKAAGEAAELIPGDLL